MELQSKILSKINRFGRFISIRWHLAPLPIFTTGTEASGPINFISGKRGVVSGKYLEVGVKHGRTFKAVTRSNEPAI